MHEATRRSRVFGLHKIFKRSHLKLTVYGHKQASRHTHNFRKCSHASAGLAQAHPNKWALGSLYNSDQMRTEKCRETCNYCVCGFRFVSFRFLFYLHPVMSTSKSVGLNVSRRCPLWLLVFQTKNCSSTQKEGYSSKHYMLEFAHINPSEHFRVYTTASTDCNSGTISDLMHRSLVVPTYNAVTALSYCCGHEAKWWPGISFRTKMMHNIVKILSV